MLINHAALATTAAISQARKVDALEQGSPEFALMRRSGSHASCTAILTPSTTPSGCSGATANRKAHQPSEHSQTCNVWKSWTGAAQGTSIVPIVVMPLTIK